jgi:hypothetical protein
MKQRIKDAEVAESERVEATKTKHRSAHVKEIEALAKTQEKIHDKAVLVVKESFVDKLKISKESYKLEVAKLAEDSCDVDS